MDLMGILNVLLYSFPALIFVVLFHELGHLILARMTGIGVEVFSIFFGRPIYKFKWKNIQWQIGWIPLGGYCKMKGQEDFGSSDEDQEHDSFYKKPRWARFLAIAGGALFNVIFSFFVFMIIYIIQERKIIPNSNIIVYPEYKNLLKLNDGDIIKKIDGEKINDWGDLMDKYILGIHRDNRTLSVKRGEQIVDVNYNLDVNVILKNTNHNPYTGFTLPELMFVNSINDNVKVKEIGKDKPYEVISPAKNHLKEGNLIMAIDSNIVLSRYHYQYYMNHNELSAQKERKFIVLNLRKGIQVLAIEDIGFKSLDEIREKILNPKIIEFKVKFLENGEKKEEFFQKKEIYINPIKIEFFNEEKKIIEREYKLGIFSYYTYSPYIYNNLKSKKYDPIEAIGKAIDETVVTIGSVFNQFKLLGKLEFDVLRQSVGGPIRILKNIADVAETGMLIYFLFVAKLSIFIGVFNLLPIPVLDGWHLFLTTIEMITRRSLSIRFVNVMQYIGLIFMLILVLLVMINDIINIL